MVIHLFILFNSQKSRPPSEIIADPSFPPRPDGDHPDWETLAQETREVSTLLLSCSQLRSPEVEIGTNWLFTVDRFLFCSHIVSLFWSLS